MAERDPYDPPRHTLCLEMNQWPVSTTGRSFDQDRSFLRQAMDKPRVLCYSSISLSLSQHQNHLGRIDLRPKAACCEISEIRFCAAVNPHWVLSKRLAWISATLKSVWYSLEIFGSSAHQNYHWNHWMRKKANLIFESDDASWCVEQLCWGSCLLGERPETEGVVLGWDQKDPEGTCVWKTMGEDSGRSITVYTVYCILYILYIHYTILQLDDRPGVKPAKHLVLFPALRAKHRDLREKSPGFYDSWRIDSRVGATKKLPGWVRHASCCAR